VCVCVVLKEADAQLRQSKSEVCASSTCTETSPFTATLWHCMLSLKMR